MDRSFMKKIFMVFAFLGLSICMVNAGGQPDTGAAAWPEKDVTITVPFSAGGVTDLTTRVLAQSLEEQWGVKGENYQKLIETSLKLEGLHRHASTHAAGIVISQEELTHYVPLYRDSKTDTVSTQYSMDYLENCGLDKLDEYYQFPGEPNKSGGFRMGDMSFTISVNSENLSKTVTAFGYLTPDKGESYPDMPTPLNEIYGRLRAVSQTTEEVCHEDIKD